MTTIPARTQAENAPTARTPEARTVAIPGVFNGRDLGGLDTARGPIRRGLLLRTGALNDLTPDGADVLARLGVRTVVDLRTADERANQPDRVREYPRLAHISELMIPLLSDFEGSPDSPNGNYLFMVEHGAPNIGAVIARLAEPGALPALIHCAAGKNRTGLVVATLLNALGVPTEQIHADHLRNNDEAGPLKYPTQTFALDTALARMAETADSVEGFLGQNGVTPKALETLRCALLSRDT